MAEERPTPDDDSGDEQTKRPARDRFGALSNRPWYRHPVFILTVAGIGFYLLNWYTAANRTGAGVPLFGG